MKEITADYIISNCKEFASHNKISAAFCCDNEIYVLIKTLRQLLFPEYLLPDEGEAVRKLYLNKLDKLEIILNKIFKNYQPAENMKPHDELTESFIGSLPALREISMTDIKAAYEGDPAAVSFQEILLCYPGVFAVNVYRIAHLFYCMRVPLVPRLIGEYAHAKTGIDIHPAVKIGAHFFIDHGTGVVIGETTEIGSHVKIYQGVTLGAISTASGQKLKDVKRHPTIRDFVTIYAGATILGGNTVIEEGAVIGSNVFITDSIPKDKKVILEAQKLIIRNRNNRCMESG
ncbi:serine O-acetyltransferase [Ruminiclostridium sufflavum DSM 19573]|uniref:Serine O-acetyltransferase n=1 Tax=Ruminiclostridium sufflavum DSM 19573 TaxID=1121337 RepID=A0A318XTS4_9FIRM|nr:serine acetyltransferase [Ruminiclostridium sufflavum]PYG90253.1 serine O-acetyltransferase [Ruminiclostridium sufflavum DSM 19573]